MLQLFYLVFACAKGPLCVRKMPFLLTRYLFTPNAKYPFYMCKIQVNASPPLLHPNTNTQPGSNACQGCKPTWRQLLVSFFCSVPIIQSQVSKWYSTTKSAKYAQQNCLVHLRMQDTLLLPLPHHPFPILLSPAICLLPGPEKLPHLEPLGIQPPIDIVIPKHLWPPLPLCSACVHRRDPPFLTSPLETPLPNLSWVPPLTLESIECGRGSPFPRTPPHVVHPKVGPQGHHIPTRFVGTPHLGQSTLQRIQIAKVQPPLLPHKVTSKCKFFSPQPPTSSPCHCNAPQLHQDL